MKKLITLLTLFLTGSLYAKEKKGWLGVYAHEPEEAVKIALEIDHGVIVDKVIKNSPAEKVGIHKGDVILSIN